MALLLGKEVEGICNRMIEDVGECILQWFGRCGEKEAIVVWVVGPPLSLHELDTVYSF